MVQGEFGVPNPHMVCWTLLVGLKLYVIVGILVWKRHVDAKGLYILSVVWPIAAVVTEVASRRCPQDWQPRASLLQFTTSKRDSRLSLRTASSFIAPACRAGVG